MTFKVCIKWKSNFVRDSVRFMVLIKKNNKKYYLKFLPLMKEVWKGQGFFYKVDRSTIRIFYTNISYFDEIIPMHSLAICM